MASVLAATTGPAGVSIRTVPFSRPVTRPGSRFVCPMNPATNADTGRWYKSAGVPTWATLPSFSTAIRSATLRASFWSWVT